MILLLINVLLLVLGTFMDMAPMILICTPILLPVVKTFGVDPVHFGMIMLRQPRHRPDHAAGRADALRRLRDRQGDDGRGDRASSGRSTARCASRSCIVTYVPALSLWLPRLLGL